jgi:hypothetical protein
MNKQEHYIVNREEQSGEMRTAGKRKTNNKWSINYNNVLSNSKTTTKNSNFHFVIVSTKQQT